MGVAVRPAWGPVVSTVFSGCAVVAGWSGGGRVGWAARRRSSGRVTHGHHHPDSPAAQEGPHAAWPFVSLRVGGRDVQTFCVPTGTGTVLMLRTSDGVMRCLPTWGAPAGAFGAATLAIAREITTHPHD